MCTCFHVPERKHWRSFSSREPPVSDSTTLFHTKKIQHFENWWSHLLKLTVRVGYIHVHQWICDRTKVLIPCVFYLVATSLSWHWWVDLSFAVGFWLISCANKKKPCHACYSSCVPPISGVNNIINFSSIKMSMSTRTSITPDCSNVDPLTNWSSKIPSSTWQPMKHGYLAHSIPLTKCCISDF